MQLYLYHPVCLHLLCLIKRMPGTLFTVVLLLIPSFVLLVTNAVQ